MQKIKIKLVDFYSPLYEEYIKNAISKVADWEISEKPDFIFYGAAGKEYLKYRGIRIYWATEEDDPDLNLCDYAIHYAELNYYDRVFHMPLFALPHYEDRLLKALNKNQQHSSGNKREKFCNFIYSNGHAEPFRAEVFKALNEYKHVDSAGRYLNNMGDTCAAGDRFGSDWANSKIEFMKDYRFTIAMGNTQKNGYLDEKIFDAWVAGTIPIFWGDPLVSDTFNKDAFIDCTDCKSAQQVVERVRFYEEDPQALLKMQQAPIVKDEMALKSYITDRRAQFEKFIQHIVLQEPGQASRRGKGSRTILYEEGNQILAGMEKQKLYKAYRRVWRKCHNRSKGGEIL